MTNAHAIEARRLIFHPSICCVYHPGKLIATDKLVQTVRIIYQKNAPYLTAVLFAEKISRISISESIEPLQSDYYYVSNHPIKTAK